MFTEAEIYQKGWDYVDPKRKLFRDAPENKGATAAQRTHYMNGLRDAVLSFASKSSVQSEEPALLDKAVIPSSPTAPSFFLPSDSCLAAFTEHCEAYNVCSCTSCRETDFFRAVRNAWTRSWEESALAFASESTPRPDPLSAPPTLPSCACGNPRDPSHTHNVWSPCYLKGPQP